MSPIISPLLAMVAKMPIRELLTFRHKIDELIKHHCAKADCAKCGICKKP